MSLSNDRRAHAEELVTLLFQAPGRPRTHYLLEFILHRVSEISGSRPHASRHGLAQQVFGLVN